MTRRQLGFGAIAAQTLASQKLAAADATPYTGPLDGFESKVDPRQFDPVVWARQRHAEAPMRLRFQAKTAAQTRAWQKKLGAKLAELMGPLPDRPLPLKPVTLEVKRYPAYRREKIVFETRPGVSVLAYLLTPHAATSPLPAVVCVPGHGRGVDDTVGIDQSGRDRTDKAGYQRDFAIQVVEKGLAAVSIEPMGFGCRRDPINKKRSLGQSACQPSAGAALLFGETMIGWRVYDIFRTIDWMETRTAEIDAKRIGCMGISGGGMATMFAAALEPRIRAAFVSGYLNTFLDSIASMSHCIDNYVPGILNWCEMADIAGLMAPRPCFYESGDRDSIFPIHASRAAFARVREIYATLGAEARTGHEVFSGEHVFHGVQGIPFLAKALGDA